ncbi:hypothetical protein PbJCM13498_19750 [Prolixibacter bellariivorans]|uniref:Lipoprotein n=1 Tax=Prolixibacter bellariivorans TaxID=314319 RepID=A0A5M4AYY1_9BACT|nr:hypothetical protein [Prolixibacter bellariivorans]GET33112.1 hypothetical protein PbJCM13498_19750 [Prolixibacter bellariivorans]
MRRITVITIAFVAILFAGCKKDEIKTTYISNEEALAEANTSRIDYTNTPITLTVDNGTTKAAMLPAGYSYTSAVDINNTNFDQKLTSDKRDLTVDAGKIVLVSPGTKISGNLTINSGATLVVAGTFAASSLQGTGTIIVNPTATVSVSNLNFNGAVKFVNYADWSFNNFTLGNGTFENHGTLTFGSLTVNGGTVQFISDGTVTVNGNIMVNSYLYNDGTMVSTKGTLTTNGGSKLVNDCHLEAQQMQSNGTTSNNSYLKIAGNLNMNGGSKIEETNSAILRVGSIKNMNGTIASIGDDYAGLIIDNSFSANWGARLTGKLDIRFNGTINPADPNVVGSKVTYKSAYFAATGCAPEYGSNPVTSFTEIADVAAPTDNRGNVLSATSVDIEGHYAYVSWHLHGVDYSGLIEVFDISDPTSPTIIQQYWNTNFDFNHLEVDGAKLYVVGSRNLDKYKISTSATLAEFTLENGELNTDNMTMIELPSSSGNCVHLADNNQLYIATGNSGGTFNIMAPTSTTLSTTKSAESAKYVDSEGSTIVGLQGGSVGQLSVFDENNGLTPVRTIPVGEITPENGKSVVRLKDGLAYVCKGTSGLMVFDVNDVSGTAVKSFNPHDGDTNGVDIDHGLIYVANGAGGVYVLDKNTFKVYGNYNYDGSANFVRAVDDYIFVANGTGGLKILMRDNP